MLTWSYSAKQLSIEDKKLDRTLTLIRGDDGGIIFRSGSEKFEIDPNDIGFVFFEEPKLFKKGTICFFDENEEVLVYICDGRRISLVIEVTKEYKDLFYAFFSIFKDNGFEVHAG